MANDRNDFLPEVRNSAWWSGDSRMAANGRGNDAVLQKLGVMERPDLSEVEAVQMGHVMQPVIGQLASAKLGIELKEADYALTHPKEVWLKSHFDFISADGQTLVEVKNYNASVRNKFDSEANIIPAADMAQLIHEAACHNISDIVLAVLFGGQNFEVFKFSITEAQKEQLIKDMAKFWASVETKQLPEPETTEQAKLIYATSAPTSIGTDVPGLAVHQRPVEEVGRRGREAQAGNTEIYGGQQRACNPRRQSPSHLEVSQGKHEVRCQTV